jgi:hypothetical protein
MTRFCSSSGISGIPKARLAVLRSRETTACEKYAGIASSRPSTLARSVTPTARTSSGSENAGHRRARPDPHGSPSR